MPLEWQAEEVCNGLRRRRETNRTIWAKVSLKIAETNVRISKVLGPENVADANTKLADKRLLEFCRSKMGVTEIPKQCRDASVSSLMLTRAAPPIKFLQANVMSPDRDSVNVIRLGLGVRSRAGMPTLYAVYGVLRYR